jgi:phenylacetate-CoA ligase
MTDETRPWAEQLELDDAAYREQLAYVLDRSPYYREKLAGAEGGLADIADLPLTEKAELRETVTAENPFGAHLCAAPGEIVRIYSTSGTTGAPSYIPLTAEDLDNWVTGSARSYAASGVVPGTTRGLSSRAPHWPRSTASASPTSPSEPGTPRS